MIPNNYRLVYSRADIQARVEQLATLITPWVDQASEKTGRDVTAIPLMHGGIFFYSDLSRYIKHSLHLYPVRASAYLGNHIQGELKIDFDIETVKGKAVLLVDEICESGRSLDEVTKLCMQAGAAEVKQAVLIKRDQGAIFHPSYVGYNYIGSEWFVGYGMDDNGRYRNLPDIYIIEK